MEKNRQIRFLRNRILKKVVSIMKLTSFFLLVSFMQVSASLYSQDAKVSIQVKDGVIEEVFQLIERQSDYVFVYNHEQLGQVGKITIDFKDKRVSEVLDVCLKGSGLCYELLDNTIVIRNQDAHLVAEDLKGKVIAGRITNTRKEPLPGVSILIKGTALGVVSDVNGKYRITLPAGQKDVSLIFSFIGMKTQVVKITTQDTLDIVMEENDTELDEVNVISTGYYNVDKRHLTSSVTSLKMDDIMMPGVSSVDQMLEGRVPGMIFMQNSGQVGATPKLKIRGTTTVLGAQSPLWVMDGVILSDPVNIDPSSINDLDFVNLLGNAISGINPDDIDQIDVLKDASATAIYGPRASNGVIVITTKKGKVGVPSISYSLTGTFRRRPRYTDRAVNVMNSQERIDYSRDVVMNKLNVPNLNSWVGYEAAYYDYYTGKIGYQEFLDEVHRMEIVNTDWLGILMRDSYSHNHSLNVSGGTDHIRYYASLGYSNENGNIRGEKSDRYSAMTSLNLSYDKFSMQFRLNGSTMKREYTPSEVGVTDYAYNTARSVPAYDENGDLWFYQKKNVSYDQPFSIINEQKNAYDKIDTESLGLSISLDYRLFPSLKAGVFCSYNVSHSDENVYFGEKTWYIADLKKVSSSTGEIDISTTLCPSGGELRMDNTKNESYSLRGTLTFNRTLDMELNHSISASLIGELSSSKYTGFKIVKRGYMPERGMIFDKVETMNKDNLYVKYNEWLLSDDARGKMKDNLTNLVGIVASFVYSYKSSYIFNVNGRIDFSNKFGDASNDKLLPIWSISGRWNLHENVLKHVDWVDMFAIKMSFGYQGNMSALDSPRLIIKKEGTDNDFQEYYSTISGYPNPNLQWEKTSTYNIDVDFSLFNSKVKGTLGYYYRYTRDAFLSKKVSVVNGVEAYTV